MRTRGCHPPPPSPWCVSLLNPPSHHGHILHTITFGDERHQKLYDVEHVRVELVTHVQEKINEQHTIFSRLHHDAKVTLTSIGSSIATL